MITKSCSHCLRSYETYPSKEQIYCSSKCQNAARRHLRKPCPQCGKDTPRYDTTYCSSECYHKSREGKPLPARMRRIQKTCSQCQRTFEAGGRSGKKTGQAYCSEKCYGRSRRVPIDRAFPTKPSEGMRHNANWSELRQKIFDRDGNRCLRCAVIEKLQCHHIIPRELGGTHEENNLATVCVDCHRKLDHTIAVMLEVEPDFDIAAFTQKFLKESFHGKTNP